MLGQIVNLTNCGRHRWVRPWVSQEVLSGKVVLKAWALGSGDLGKSIPYKLFNLKLYIM